MIEHFTARRRERWSRLNTLVLRASSAWRSISVAELDELARLYRQTSSDLAIAQRDFPRDLSTRYINDLLLRAHGVIYSHAPSPISQLRRFFSHDLPVEYRAAWRHVVVAALLLFVPMLAAAVATVADARAAEVLIPTSLLDEIRAGHTWFDVKPGERPYAASFIMTHNLQVAFLILGGGMLGGLGSVAALVFNGASIGGIAGALIAYGLGEQLVSFVSPHGFLELSAVVLAGACGLMLGSALLWATLQPRRQALVAAGARSVRLLAGLIPFLVIAGLIEGFVSPVELEWPIKLAIGLSTFAALYSYLLLVGRGPTGVSEQRPFL